jgi:hypothetical protein
VKVNHTQLKCSHGLGLGVHVSSICKGKHYLTNGSLLVRLSKRVRHIFGGGFKNIFGVTDGNWKRIGYSKQSHLMTTPRALSCSQH